MNMHKPAQPTPAQPLPEAIVARLQEFAANFHAPNPFAPGDLVTPRRDSLAKKHPACR